MCLLAKSLTIGSLDNRMVKVSRVYAEGLTDGIIQFAGDFCDESRGLLIDEQLEGCCQITHVSLMAIVVQGRKSQLRMAGEND
jgi:hypothetical protein